jgi:hypothetical protein
MSAVAVYQAKVDTHDKARLALGAAATVLGRATGAVETIADRELRDETRELFRVTMRGLTSNLARLAAGGGALPSSERLYAARSLAQVDKCLSIVDDNTRSTFAADYARAFMTTLETAVKLPGVAIDTTGELAGKVAGAAGSAANALLSPMWWVVVIVAIGATVYFTAPNLVKGLARK